MGRFNNRRAQQRAEENRNVPSRARFSKGPPKKSNSGRGGGRGGREEGGRNNSDGGRGGGRFGRGGRGGSGGGRSTAANDAVVKKIQDRVVRQRADIGGISITTKKRKAHPLDGIDISKLDTVALSAESVAVVEELLRAYDVWGKETTINDGNADDAIAGDDDDDGTYSRCEEKKQESGESECNMSMNDAFDVDMYDDYCGDYDDEPGEQQCCETPDMNNSVEEDSISNSDQECDNNVEIDAVKQYKPTFLRLTEHYSFKEQDVVRALNASKKRIHMSKKESELHDNDNPDENKKKDDNDVILEMAIDWLSLHLNESDLHAGFRTQKRKPSPGTSVSNHDRMMANTVPMKFKALPHDSISVMPKLTQLQYEKEAREKSLEWRRQYLMTELIRMGFKTKEIDTVFTSFQDEMEILLDRIPEEGSSHDSSLLSLVDDKLLAKLFECTEIVELGEEIINTQESIDMEIDEMATMERDQEKEVLEAIYAEGFQSFNSSDGNTERNRYLLQITPTNPLQAPAQNDKCYLHVLTRRGYPLVRAPFVWFFNGSLPPSLLRRINVSLIKKARAQLGQAAVYELMEYLAENVSSWQKEFIDEEVQTEKASEVANGDKASITEEDSDDDDEIDYFTTTFTAEERKLLSRRQRQKLRAAEKSYSRDAIILEKQRLKQQKDDERRERIQLENKTISSRMADREVNKRWQIYVQEEAEKAYRKTLNDELLEGVGREDARAAAEKARLEVLSFHGEIDEGKGNIEDEHNTVDNSCVNLADDAENVVDGNAYADDKVDITNQLQSNTPKSEATPKTLLFVEKLRKMYEQKAKEKAEGNAECPVRLATPLSDDGTNPLVHAPTPVVASSPCIEEVIDDLVTTQRNQPWLIAPDARVPISEKNGVQTSHTMTRDEMQQKEKMSKILRADLKRKYDKPSGKFHDMLLQREALPAYKMRAKLVMTIRSSQVTVVSGDTGCGKTTQLPQLGELNMITYVMNVYLIFCQFPNVVPSFFFLVLDDMIQNNVGADANIIVTQPRRISAIGVSERIAAERCEKIGQTVGYSIRLESRRSAKTRLLLCTTGVLLRRLQVDPDLSSVSHGKLDRSNQFLVNTYCII